ncbi:hypothetical protein JT358_08605 [Micrococcales bacterium 31B]|nr:hypothetical protein [Micrococcales bacterium 31B]
MMSEFTKQNTAATEQYLAFLAKGQEQLLEQARQFATLAADAPQASAVPVAPVADLPTPRELTEAAFSFTEKLIAQQRNFMQQYLDIAERKVADAKVPAAAAKKA